MRDAENAYGFSVKIAFGPENENGAKVACDLKAVVVGLRKCMHQIASGSFEAVEHTHPLADLTKLNDAEDASSDASSQLAGLADRNSLLDEIRRLKAEQKVLRDRESKIMELLGTKSPDQILHDFRNVLNEKELFRVLAFRDEK